MLTTRDVAAQFVAARKASRGFLDFPGEVPNTLERAYGIQAATITEWPDAICGWKVGRITGDVAEQLGADRFIGPIFEQSVIRAKPDTPFAAIPGGSAVFEAELIVVVGNDGPTPHVTGSIEEAAMRVGSMHIGVEVAGSPLASMGRLGPLATIAAFGGNNGLIIGPEIKDWQSHVPRDVWCRSIITDMVVGSAGAIAVPGGPLTAFAFALKQAAALGHPLKRGAYVSTGAITGMHDVEIGQRCSADFGPWGRLDCVVTPSPAAMAMEPARRLPKP